MFIDREEFARDSIRILGNEKKSFRKELVQLEIDTRNRKEME